MSLQLPLPVAVTVPKMTTRTAVVKILVGIITFALDAWVVMVAAAAVTTWHPGYWTAVMVVVGVRALRGRPDYLAWTHEAKS